MRPGHACRWRPPFTVYVCTAAEREYALEVWRLLDPEAQLIPFGLRGTHIKAGMHKKDISTVLSLQADPAHLNALRTAMPLAVVLDDRLDVRLSRVQSSGFAVQLRIAGLTSSSGLSCVLLQLASDPEGFRRQPREGQRTSSLFYLCFPASCDSNLPEPVVALLQLPRAILMLGPRCLLADLGRSLSAADLASQRLLSQQPGSCGQERDSP